MGPRLVLASTSPYRRELLERLRIPFEVAAPQVEESPLPGESPPDMAERLAVAKARAVAASCPDALVIGSDQVAYAGDEIYGKPGTAQRAIEQLERLSGRSVIFHTAVALLDSRSMAFELRSVPVDVRFRSLGRGEIERYVAIDNPLNCAGSARSESIGIALLEYMRCDDPTALIGLPLIALCDLLRRKGIRVP